MDLDKRKSQLFNTIVKEYIKTAEPVGSTQLAGNVKFKLSSATIRNEMVELEKQGLICQPHTSAGRIPTEVGWRYYLDNFLKEGQISTADQKTIKNFFGQLEKAEFECLIKKIARDIAEMVDGAVVVALSPDNVYYTGISNIFKQPEFFEPDVVQNMSQIIDDLDSVMGQVFDEISEPTIMIGKDNPFGHDTGIVLTKYNMADTKGVLGIIGPTRMDYQRNYDIINYLIDCFEDV
jgi:heat-inducible transcriptional repressor